MKETVGRSVGMLSNLIRRHFSTFSFHDTLSGAQGKTLHFILAHGQECIIDDGVAVLPDRSAFAGSVCTADRCVRTMYQQAEVRLEDAVRMMTYNPAKILGIQGRKGSLSAGMDADVVIFDDEIRIQSVLVKGKKVVG